MPAKIFKGFEQYINPLGLKPISHKEAKTEAKQRLLDSEKVGCWGVRTQSAGSSKTNKRRPVK